jgi:hypothetical protein
VYYFLVGRRFAVAVVAITAGGACCGRCSTTVDATVWPGIPHHRATTTIAAAALPLLPACGYRLITVIFDVGRLFTLPAAKQRVETKHYTRPSHTLLLIGWRRI